MVGAEGDRVVICVLPGCRNQVTTIGDTYMDCLAAFGDWLQPSEERMTAEEIAARDTYAERAYHAQRSSR